MHEKINSEFERLQFPEGWRRYLRRLVINFQSGSEGLHDELIDPEVEMLETLRSFQVADEHVLRLTLLSRAIARSESLRIRARYKHEFWNPLQESLNEFRLRHAREDVVHYMVSTHSHPSPDIVEYLVRDTLRQASDS